MFAAHFTYSRWAEDMILYSTKEFGFISLSDAYRLVQNTAPAPTFKVVQNTSHFPVTSSTNSFLNYVWFIVSL